MDDIRGEIVIHGAPEDVFDFVADERNRYDPRMVRADQISDGPVDLGTRFRTEIRSFGRTVGMVVEITGYERPKRLASSTHLPSMDIHSTLVFDPVSEGTRLRWSTQLVPRGILRAISPLLARTGRRQAQAIWESLKRVLEAQEGTSAMQTGRPSRS